MATTKSVTVGMDKVVISGREQSFPEQKSHASEKTEVWRFFYAMILGDCAGAFLYYIL